jgi:hypothetical protein
MPDTVICYDGSVNAMHALEWAMQHAALQHATLTILAVNEVAASPWTGNPAVMPSCRHAAGRGNAATSSYGGRECRREGGERAW